MDPLQLEQAARLADFLLLYHSDRALGSALGLAEYQARFPEIEELVASEYAALESARARAGVKTNSGAMQLPGYRIVRELGHGGQGTVVLAEDLELKRLVALKVLRTPLGLPSPERLARLRREVSILARLEHPGICSVYRAHLDGDPPFVAMRYVKGPTLAQILSASQGSTRASDEVSVTTVPVRCVPLRTPDVDRLLSFFEEAGRALHAAHEAGVVHRDIKPANIVASDEGRPVLLDFGLARTLDGQESLVTRTGELFGTPAYMSREQLSVPTEALDRRTDVYSLGVTLFECATGRRPFEAPSQHRLERAISLEPVPRATRLNPALPADIDVVLATAMEKDRTRRYATALDLAEELRRIRERRPVLARPTGYVLRARRWSQRNPVIATAVALLTLGALGLSIAVVLLVRETGRTRDALRVAKGRILTMAAQSTLELDPLDALDQALESYALSPDLHSRSALYAALDAQRVERLLDQDNSPFVTALASARRHLAVALRDGTAVVYRLPGGEPVRLGAAGAVPTAVAISPDGSRIALGHEEGALALHVAEKEDAATLLPKHDKAVRALAFSADGARLASGDEGGGIRIHSLGSERGLILIDPGSGPLGGLRFSPDGRWLVSWSGEARRALAPDECALLVWNASDGSPVARLEGHKGLVIEARFAPDGSSLASGSHDKTVWIWELPGGRGRRLHEFAAKVHDIGFSPDGRRLAVAYDQGEPGFSDESGATVLDAANGVSLLELRGHSRAVKSIEWNEDGSQLLTASYDGSARIWSATDGRELSCLPTAHGLVYEARFLDRARMLVRLQKWAMVALVDDLAGCHRLRGHRGAVVHADFRPDGSWLVSCDVVGEALVHDTRSGALLARLDGGSKSLTRVAFCRDGSRVLTASSDGSCKLFDPANASCVASFQVGSDPMNLLRVLDDGERFLASSGRALVLFDLSGRRLQELWGAEAALTCLDVSSDERFVAAGAEDRAVRVWSLETGDLLLEVKDWTPSRPEQKQVFDVHFHPDGTGLITSANDGRVRFYLLPSGELAWTVTGYRCGELEWVPGCQRAALMPKWSGSVILLTNPKEGSERISLTPYPIGRSTAMDVSPDGSRLLVSSTDGRTLLWDLTDDSLWATVEGHDGAVLFAAFSPDGSCFATGSADGTVRLWPMDPEAAARASRPERIRAPGHAAPADVAR